VQIKYSEQIFEGSATADHPRKAWLGPQLAMTKMRRWLRIASERLEREMHAMAVPNDSRLEKHKGAATRIWPTDRVLEGRAASCYPFDTPTKPQRGCQRARTPGLCHLMGCTDEPGRNHLRTLVRRPGALRWGTKRGARRTRARIRRASRLAARVAPPGSWWARSCTIGRAPRGRRGRRTIPAS
jgi:hypothetical protein